MTLKGILQNRIKESLKDLPIKSFKKEEVFPISSILALYEVSSYSQTYYNYFEGFKLLASWLSPLDIPKEEELQFLNTNLLGSYDINEIAKILGTHPQHILDLSITNYVTKLV